MSNDTWAKMRLSIDVNEVAAAVARMGSIEQGKFLAVFLDELAKDCGTNYAAQSQMAHIDNELKPHHRELLAMLTLGVSK